jgi:hypothetical protein
MKPVCSTFSMFVSDRALNALHASALRVGIGSKPNGLTLASFAGITFTPL